MGVFIIPPLPPVWSEELRTAGPLRSAGITPFPRYYGPVRHPLVVGRLPGAAGYTAYPASALAGRDEEGFSSCSVCPGRRAVANHPAGATRPLNRLGTGRAAFALTVAGSASGATHFRGHLAFTCVTARTTRTYPAGRVVEGLQDRRFPSGLPSQLRGFRFLPRQDWLLLNTSAFPGRTTGLAPFDAYGSSRPLPSLLPGLLPLRIALFRSGSVCRAEART